MSGDVAGPGSSTPRPTTPVPPPEPLPGTHRADAERDEASGTWRWWPGDLLPDRGQAGGAKLGLLGPRVDPVTGRVEIGVGHEIDAAKASVAGFVGERSADGGSVIVLSRSGPDASGVRVEPTGLAWGISSDLVAARQRALAWKDAAGRLGAAGPVPAFVGCCTLRFEWKGTRYTISAVVEYADGGDDVTVTFRDGS